MNTLPPEQLLIIFNHLPIADQRNLHRTNQKFYTDLPFTQAEKEFQTSTNDKYYANDLCKLTYELIHSGYAKLIPKHYIRTDNHILYKYEQIFFDSAKN